MKKGFCYEEETDRFVCRQGEYLAFQKLIYKKSTQNYYRLYSRSKKQCKNCPYFSACATDLGTVRINASAYYPSFYRNSRKVGTSDYLMLMLSWAVMISLCHAVVRLPRPLSWNIPFDGADIRPIMKGLSSYIHALPAL